MSPQKIGEFSAMVVATLRLSIAPGTPIYIGASNIKHMENTHPADFLQYGKDVALIIKKPDYVGVNPSDGSIEYVKEYRQGNEFVKVAVRVSIGGRHYARTIYKLKNSRVRNFIAKGTLKKV